VFFFIERSHGTHLAGRAVRQVRKVLSAIRRRVFLNAIGKRNLDQIERGKTINDLFLMRISIYMFVFLCVPSLIPWL
jgi:hypothetical protein